MGIYRGPGGPGDATADATNEATRAVEAANEAELSKDQAAASATSAANSATSAASSAASASTSESSATAQASAAESSASAAATSASSASTSATSASSSASTASTSATNAASSESNAATSATSASNSASAASTSATSASTSATTAANEANDAEASAASALTSANTATTKADEASTSASNAATSETNASGSATAAAASATNANNSASSASTSATTATTQAGVATTQAANASTSASNAATSESNAASSESNAATSETNASTSETNAGNSAIAASTSETNANNSATAASTSETNAASSASAASTSATNASNSASAASLSASAADISESNAASSESNAATSASTATTQAGIATTQASNAASSASSASTSASEALTSADNASTSESNAATSASTATTQATNASNSASDAFTSETNAASSASAASTSEINAASSATNASTSASNAVTSETNAASSASSASTSASNASTSETNAANSASAASTSETNAATSATTAQNAATTATTQATLATTAATNASTSETNAATSATNAASSASSASTSASTATTQATNAATSASNASTSASAAAGSATSASAAADAALSALDSFDDRYLGTKSSDPTLDNDGNALVSGALYFNTVDSAMKVYDGSTWLAAYASLSGALIASNNLSDLNNVATARTSLGLGSLATLSAVNAATITDNSVGAAELNVSGNGTASQYLRSDGDGTFTWATPPDTTANQTITLSGDASGSGTTAITVTVADNSHNHTIANVAGLQTALDGKVDDSQVLTNVPSGAVFTDTVYTHPSTHPATIITTTDEFTYSNSTNVQDVLDDLDQAIANVNAKDPVITLTGDVTGSGTMTNLGNVSITATVGNDSHSHSNYLPLSGGRLSGELEISFPDASLVFSDETGNPTEQKAQIRHEPIDVNNPGGLLNALHIESTGPNLLSTGLVVEDKIYAEGTQRVFADNYHPNADKWTTARTLSLTGDVAGSTTWDGSGNVSITATVADDSHNHIIGNVDGLQTALDGKQPLDADLTALGGLAKTDGNFIVGNGSTWVAESGATARASLGLGTAATTNSTAYATAAQGALADTAYSWGNHASAGYLTSLSGALLTGDIGVTVQAYDSDISTVAASQAEMEAGTQTALRSMSPLRVKQAINANASTPTIASTAEAQAGTNNTTFLTPLRLREGLNATGSPPVYACRAWVNFNGTGTVAIRDSGNISSIIDNGTGDYTVNYTVAMPDANYSVTALTNPNVTSGGYTHLNNNNTSSSCRIKCYTVAGGNYIRDVNIGCVAIFR